MKKICSKCKIPKDIEEFSKTRARCKLCEKEWHTQYNKNKEKLSLKIKEDKENRPEYLEFVKNYSNKIICGDSLEVMKKMPDECIDLTITSPPYNLNIRKTFGNTENWKGKWNNSKLQSVGYDTHEDNMPEEEYILWQKNILKECFRLIKEDGAIYYNMKWRVQDGLYQQRSEIIEGFPLRQIIIWKKAGGINFNEGYYLPTYEVIYLIAKPKFKIANKSYKYGDVWEIPQKKGSWHPAPFPLEIPRRALEATNGNIILDPFVGSGTVAEACIKVKKNYIGIDISQTYCDKTQKYLDGLAI